MDKTQIQTAVQKALANLRDTHSALFEQEVNERSVTHWLAIYLMREFPDYDIDCEFNRMVELGAAVVKKSILFGAMVSTRDLTAKTVYPDIIVHHRADPDHNLLVLEAKKPNLDHREDYQKLNGFMAKKTDGGLGYRFSSFVTLDAVRPVNELVIVKEEGEHWP